MAREPASDPASSHSRRRCDLRACRACGARHVLQRSAIGFNFVLEVRAADPAAAAVAGTARPGLQSMSFAFALLLTAQPPLLTTLPASLPTPLE